MDDVKASAVVFAVPVFDAKTPVRGVEETTTGMETTTPQIDDLIG